MRTSFELKFTAADYESARTAAANYISRFLGIAASEVEDRVDIELKVEADGDKFEVTAFGKFKNGVSVTSLNPISAVNRLL